ncbi:uncharacterized protein [Rutidosis leptorrhynchoides]|uniref:uncharacterized protein n=1 Tax=Rutidosis leptorrhynchoides TaxID=125765 RepID=UPI003A990D5A
MKPNRKLKKPQPSCSKLELEEIIGLTVTNCNGLASSFFDSKFVYIAGCVVVIYDVDSGTQSHVMVCNRSPKPLGCVSVSHDGSYIAAGESVNQPSIIVWSSATLASISELRGHRYGVACTAFSPDGKHLISVGTPQDGYQCVWDWRSGTLVKKLKACAPFSDVASVSFSTDSKFILTSGKRHIKIWTVGLPTKSRAKTETVSLPMHGKHVNLGHHKGCTFVDITSPYKSNAKVGDEKGGDIVLVYALTGSGVLCVIHGGLRITHSVNLKVEKGYALSASQELIACACSNGIVKLYSAVYLEYAGDLHYNEGNQNSTIDAQLVTYPDAVACCFSTSEKLVVIYRDHSLYIWNIHGEFQATKCCVLASHGGCIWDIKNLLCENMHHPSLACVARGCTGGVSFATCSADGTIRLWDLALQSVSTERRSTLSTVQHPVVTNPLGTLCLVGAGTFERESVASDVITKGYRSMAVSSDGRHLVAGGSDGHLHIFNLYTSDYTCIQDAHEGEVLSLNFSLPVMEINNAIEGLESYYFLASGGRDKKIHLYDVNRNFDLIASIDDNSAAVTSVKLTGNGRKIISCGSDRSLIVRDNSGHDDEYNVSHSNRHKAYHATINDISLDPTTQIAVTVGQDKKINIFDIAAGQVIRTFKQGRDFGDPIKVALDPSCSYVACAYSDRSICMYDFMSGDMVARGMGHGEAINGIIFLPDCKHIGSVSGDGCIFIWKVPGLLTSRMLQRINENCSPLSPSTFAQGTAANPNKCFEENHTRSLCKGTPLLCEERCPTQKSSFNFSVSRLPQWAKSKFTSPVIPVDPISSEVVGQEEHPSIKPSANDLDHVALCTPSNHKIDSIKKLCDPSNSKDSASQGICRSFALDKRWLTIHTVCLDPSDSPDVYNMKQQMVPLSSNLPQGTNIECTSPTANFSFNHTSYNSTCDVGDAACMEKLFQIKAPKSSARKSYSAQFTVKHDLLQRRNHVLHAHISNFAETLNSCKQNVIDTECSSLTGQEDFERGRDNQQGMMSSKSQQNLSIQNHIASQSNPDSPSSKSMEVKTTETNDQQKECDIIINEKHNTFYTCIEALRALDASSKTALQVFSKLRDASLTHENLEGPEAQFYADSAVMFQSIAKNVHEIAKLANSRDAHYVDIRGFEPLL